MRTADQYAVPESKAWQDVMYVAVDDKAGPRRLSQEQEVVEEVRFEMPAALVLLEPALVKDSPRSEEAGWCGEIEVLSAVNGDQRGEREGSAAGSFCLTPAPGTSTLSDNQASFSFVSFTRIASLISFNVFSAARRACSSGA